MSRSIKQRLTCAIMFSLKPTAMVGRKLEGIALHSLLYNIRIDILQNTRTDLHSSTGPNLPKFQPNSSWTYPLADTKHGVVTAAAGPVPPLHHEQREVPRNSRNRHLYTKDFKPPTRPYGLKAERSEPYGCLPWTKALPHVSSACPQRSMVALSSLDPLSPSPSFTAALPLHVEHVL